MRLAYLASAFLPLFVFSGVSVNAQTASPSTALLNSRAIAINAATDKVYAVAPRENAVAIFNPTTNSASSVLVGASPVAIAVNSATNRIYVVNSGDGTVAVLDGGNDSVIATLDVGPNPYVVAANSVANKIYVSNTFSDVITIIDGRTNSMSKMKGSSADAIAIDEKLGKIFLLGYENPNLIVLSATLPTTTKLRVGMHLWGMVLDQEKSKLYVTRSGNAEIAVVDEFSGSITAIPTRTTPCAVAANSATNTLYVVNHTDDSVTAIDAVKSVAIATIKVGKRPQGIAVDPVRNRIYVANRNSDSISVIDGAQNSVLQTIQTGKNPFALVVNPRTGQLFVTTIAGPALSLVQEGGGR